MFPPAGEKERERERQRQRETETDRDRQPDGQTGKVNKVEEK